MRGANEIRSGVVAPWFAAALVLALAAGCPTDDDDEPLSPPRPPAIGPAEIVVPSAGLPAEVALQPANNNLDVIDFGGRTFLAFRTAPSHFASADVELFVVSSADEQDWRFEGRFAMDTDLREPRLLALDGRLLLYFAVLGTSAIDFEPQGTMVTEWLGEASWSEPRWIYEPGVILWRTRASAGAVDVIGYIGGENIYDFTGATIDVHWLTTTDGTTLEPAVPGQPVVLSGGVSETDLARLDDGTVIAVARNEEGDEDGWGSKICRAEADAPGDWRCVSDPRKYDSPLVFRHGDHVWLIGRRNVTDSGNYDLFLRDLEPTDQTLQYLWDYWHQPKRCALWWIDPEQLAVHWVADLPSRGDTCFPAARFPDDDVVRVYNYTSPLDGPDLDWLDGQTGETRIVRCDLTFP